MWMESEFTKSHLWSVTYGYIDIREVKVVAMDHRGAVEIARARAFLDNNRIPFFVTKVEFLDFVTLGQESRSDTPTYVTQPPEVPAAGALK